MDSRKIEGGRAVFENLTGLSQSWTLGSRGKFCPMLDNHPELAEWVDFGIVGDGYWHHEVQWKHPEYGCGGSTTHGCGTASARNFGGLFLDVAGMDAFTDRIPIYWLFLVQQLFTKTEEKGLLTFLFHTTQAWRAYAARSDLANVADVVKVARLDVLKTSRIASAASALTKERLTIMRLCATF